MIEPLNCLVVGGAYTGKTYLVGKAIQRSPRPLVVIVHTQHDMSYLKQLPPAKTLIIRMTQDVEIPPLEQLSGGGQRRYLYFVIMGLHGEALQNVLTGLTARVTEHGNLLWVIDEAHLFLDMRTAPETMVAALRGGRHWGVDWILVTHRLNDIAPDVRSVITYMAVFKTVSHLDRERLYQSFWGDWQPIRYLDSLPRWHYLFWEAKTGQLYHVVP